MVGLVWHGQGYRTSFLRNRVIKGKKDLEKGEKSGKKQKIALRDQRRERVATRSINKITPGRLQRRRRNRKKAKQRYLKKKNANRSEENEDA